jgi:site-specific recombinase XerD
LTSLREFSKWAGYSELFTDYRAPDAGQAIPHPIPEGMAGVRKLLAATDNERQQALVALCGMAGLRLAEALSVTAADFIFTQGGDRSGEATLRVRGKGDVTRYVPLSEEALRYLVAPIARVMGTSNPVVPLNERFARRCITNLGVKARLQRRIASHDLRATFATALYDRTKDQRLVQIALGHKSGRTTEGYIAVEARAIREGVELL